jgi:N-methylhydantoinase B/oxoprolinase/acetone carboxylase alpha subunit
MDGVELEILWSNVIGIVTERAKARQRIDFSPVVREAGDLACALFDGCGCIVAPANARRGGTEQMTIGVAGTSPATTAKGGPGAST